ncbi:MAG: hypothetical protein BWY63_02928 [Chloroflexi bacterium ADurb.Bin360]|nr:MAG: hypothetical protein BWY63_02928 [Chloroflexi bacterium ADurb.Bin360]
MGTHWRPPPGDGIVRGAFSNGLRRSPTTVGTQEGFTLCIKARQGRGAGEVSKVIPAFTILGLVINDTIFHLHLANAEVALEVGRIVLRIPEREFYGGEQRKRRRL